jgi:hypothetical protein
MQPDNQQGFYRTDQGQPVPAAVPPQPVATVTTQAAVAAAIAEPAVTAVVDTPEDRQDQEPTDAPVTWTAYEYLHQEKGTMWFIVFTAVIVLLFALSVFLMKSWSFAVLLGVIAIVVVIYSRRPPRELTYSLSDEGLFVDQKLHKFSDFKSFGVIRDGQEFSVMLIPTQRFQPGVTVYFPEEVGEAIVDLLGAQLPMKDLKLDAVDRLVRLLRL